MNSVKNNLSIKERRQSRNLNITFTKNKTCVLGFFLLLYSITNQVVWSRLDFLIFLINMTFETTDNFPANSFICPLTAVPGRFISRLKGRS